MPVPIGKLASDLAPLRPDGHRVVLVTSGAVTAGVAAMHPGGQHPGGQRASEQRPTDPVTLQALSAIGQHRLMRVYDDAFAALGVHAGQVLLAPIDFAHRPRYLHARDTLRRLLDLGVLPIVNENDAIADDEIRFGDNDRLAALVAHLVRADLLVLLTDTPGLFSADPRLDEGPPSSSRSSRSTTSSRRRRAGRAATVHAVAWRRSWPPPRWPPGRACARSSQPPSARGVLADAVAGLAGSGTGSCPHRRSLPARKLWIAFALKPAGVLVVDDGARPALVERGTSLLAAGVREAVGGFVEDDAVEIRGPDGAVFAKGIVRVSAARAGDWLGRRTAELPPSSPRRSCTATTSSCSGTPELASARRLRPARCRGGRLTPKTSERADRAASSPQRPCTPGPGGVEDEQR